MSKNLTDADINRAALKLTVPPDYVRAVLEVEAPKGGFQPDGQVTILFERHYFHRLTNGKFDRSNPRVSNAKAGGYGKYSEQHDKLREAVALDRTAALMSASWGKPQIMGENWALAGATSLQDFINKMSASEGAQLDLMVNFITNNRQRAFGLTLWEALMRADTKAFARIYNGPNYAAHEYDKRLADAGMRL